MDKHIALTGYFNETHQDPNLILFVWLVAVIIGVVWLFLLIRMCQADRTFRSALPAPKIELGKINPYLIVLYLFCTIVLVLLFVCY